METARSNTYGIVSLVCSTTPGYVLVIADKPEPNTRHIVPIADLETSSSNLGLLTIADVIARADYDLEHWRNERHNGWSNVETWQLFNWLGNSEDWNAEATQTVEIALSEGGDEREAKTALTAWVKEEIFANFENVELWYSDFLKAFFERVNMAAITEYYIGYLR